MHRESWFKYRKKTLNSMNDTQEKLDATYNPDYVLPTDNKGKPVADTIPKYRLKLRNQREATLQRLK